MTLMSITAAVLIGVIEGSYLVKKGMGKELITVGIMLLIAVILQISSNLGMITLKNLIQKLFDPIGRMIFTKL